MKIGSFSWKNDWPFLLTAGLAILLQLGGPDSVALFRFDRADVAPGQLWRVMTGNFLHLGVAHLLMNLAGLALLGIAGRNLFSGYQWAIILLFSLLGTGVGLYFLSPGITWYVGLSGVLHGLILALCVALIAHQPRIALGIAVVVVGKLLWEQWQGAIPLTSQLAGGTVVVDAHLYGSLAGVLAALPCIRWREKSNKSPEL